MVKIINGKRYDTETAKKIAGWDNGYGYGDFYYCSEDLFVKRTGEYFIEYAGGAASKYCESAGNTSYGSTGIIPLTENEAKEWMEQKADGETYIKLFGDVEE